MGIEFTYNSIQIDHKDMKELFPDIALIINSSMPKKKRSYRKRKKKETVGHLIQEIIDSLDEK